MRHPWQTWLIFSLCLILAVTAMGWLTHKVLELDRAEVAAREELDAARRRAEELQRQAEVEELVSSALWRIDTALAPMLAQEAARPHFLYQCFYAAPSEPSGGAKGTKVSLVPSPLLEQPPPFVKLHFQYGPDDRLVSPQCPEGEWKDRALALGCEPSQLTRNSAVLADLREVLRPDELLARLPDEPLPELHFGEAALESFLAGNTVWNFRTLNPTNTSTFVPNLDSNVPPQREPLDTQQIANSAYPAAVGQQAQRRTTEQSAVDYAPGQYDVPQRNQNSYGLNGVVINEQPSPGSQAPLQQQAEIHLPQSPQGQEASQLDNDLRLQQNRSGAKFDDRSRVYQSYAQQALVQQQRFNNDTQREERPHLQLVSEGVSRPVWIGGELFLARRVKLGANVVLQGCWLDWPALKEQLLAEVSDLAPEADLVPGYAAADAPSSRLLATLPVAMRMPPPPILAATPLLSTGSLSPLIVALWIAWGCLGVAAVAVAALLLGVVSLSERRAAFVAAVTHELRTPLTTFRMYAEMLAEGMVPSAERRQQYLDTLRVEADRLAHLVENVLLYARLERGPGQGGRQKVSLAALVSPMLARLRERSALAGMELVCEPCEEAAEVELKTDPTAVEQILFNLVDNACKYAAGADDRRIVISTALSSGFATITVRDHGPGLAPEAAARLFEPFSKSAHEAAASAPGVGLGLALSKRLADELGGDLRLAPGPGARFILTLPTA